MSPDRAASTVDETAEPELGPGVSMIGADLSGQDLRNADLRNSDLSNANLTGARLHGCDLRGAVLHDAVLDGALLVGADLRGADLGSASITKAQLGGADVSGASFFNADLTGTSLTRVTATGTDFRRADMRDVRLRDSVLAEADLTGADLRGVELSGTDVHRASFRDTDLRDAGFRGIRRFTEADWVGTNIYDVDFTGAYLVRRTVIDQNYLEEFRRQSKYHGFLYWVWWVTSDCGRSFLRWGVLTLAFMLMFAGLYDRADIDFGDYPTGLSPVYFSVVTLTTLGYGDVLPASSGAQALVIAEVVVGYVMLGGLMSIFATKMGRRGE